MYHPVEGITKSGYHGQGKNTVMPGTGQHVFRHKYWSAADKRSQAALQTNKLFGINRLGLSMMSSLAVSADSVSHRRHSFRDSVFSVSGARTVDIVPRSAALFDGLPLRFMETDRPLPPATNQKVNGPECGNGCQNRKYLMNGQYFVVSWPAEAQQTAGNDHEHKK